MLLTSILLSALDVGGGLKLKRHPYVLTWSCSPLHGYDAHDMSVSCLDIEELASDASDQSLRVAGAADAKKHKPTLWVHIHKAAGSTICAMALANKETVVQPMENCNWKPYDVVWPAEDVDYPPTCEKREEVFRQQGATWGHIERELHVGDFCPQYFTYGIMLRDPIALARSKFNFAYKAEKATLTDHKIALECVEHLNEACNRTKSDWWMFFDNWVTRKLNGKEAVALPPRQVARTHMQEARARLQRFSVIAILENGEETMNILGNAFGWKAGWEHKNPSPGAIEFTPEEEATLKRLMAWDYMLYDYARSLPASVRDGSSA